MIEFNMRLGRIAYEAAASRAYGRSVAQLLSIYGLALLAAAIIVGLPMFYLELFPGWPMAILVVICGLYMGNKVELTVIGRTQEKA